MNIVIVPSNGLVQIDGENIEGIDLSWIAPNVHAISWNGNKGEVQITNAEGMIESNLEITSFSEYSPTILAFNEAKAVLNPPVPAPTLLSRRLAVWDKIKTHRSFVESDGVFVQGHWFHSDSDSRIKFMRLDRKAELAIAAGSSSSHVLQVAGNNIYWKTVPNIMIPMTCSIAQGVVAATELLDALGYARAEILRNQVMASQNPESVDIISGWPTTYSTRPAQ